MNNDNISIIVFDTNFLLVPIQYRINVYEEIKDLVEGRVYYLILPELFTEIDLKSNDVSNKKFHREVSGALEFYEKQKERFGDLIIQLSFKPLTEKASGVNINFKSAKVAGSDDSVYSYYCASENPMSEKIVRILNGYTDIKKRVNDVDDILLMVSERLKGSFKHVFIATNDKELRRRARALDIQTIVLYQRRILKVL